MESFYRDSIFMHNIRIFLQNNIGDFYEDFMVKIR